MEKVELLFGGLLTK